MKILLLGYKKGFGVGVEKYSFYLFNWLKEKADVEFIGSDRKVPFSRYLNSFFYLPNFVKKALKEKEEVVFHALSQHEAVKCKPLLVTLHDVIPLTKYKNSRVGVAEHFLNKFLYLRAIKNAEKIIVLSSQTKLEIQRIFKVEENKIELNNFGVDKKIFRPLKRKEGPFSIGYIGSTSKRKRIDIVLESFLRAIKEYNLDCRLIIGGFLTDKNIFPLLRLVNVKKLVNKFSSINEKVKILGFIPERKLPKVYNSLDISIVPSDYEGFGLPIIESASCGTPVIVRKESRIPEEVKKCAIVVKTHEIPKKIFELASDKSYYLKERRKAIKESEKFSLEKHGEKMIKIYKEFE